MKEICPGISLEGLMLKLKLQYFGHLMQRADSLEKTDAGRDWEQEEKGTTEDEMARWHHWLDGHEFEWTLGVVDRQGGLACWDSWGCKESDTTEWLNWTEWTERWTVPIFLYMYTRTEQLSRWVADGQNKISHYWNGRKVTDKQGKESGTVQESERSELETTL